MLRLKRNEVLSQSGILASAPIVPRLGEAAASTFRPRLQRLLTGVAQVAPMQSIPVLSITRSQYTDILI
ncbi:MAG: hypothetical protein CL923_09325 [Deltaproteobacteria bacterium]|nr:hypothetical protein [Deltaproteobacteria bacterium]MBQ32734.1 hypothetical protein [Deltaproteobacteria bacterium]